MQAAECIPTLYTVCMANTLERPQGLADDAIDAALADLTQWTAEGRAAREALDAAAVERRAAARRAHALGLSYAQLATAMGVTRPAVQKLMRTEGDD